MCRYKNGNPKRTSQFLCLHCMKINQLSGIQRGGHQREKYHIKDLLCINPECKDFSYTKNIEIRWCDTYEDIYEKAIQIREQYYSDKTENNISRKVG